MSPASAGPKPGQDGSQGGSWCTAGGRGGGSWEAAGSAPTVRPSSAIPGSSSDSQLSQEQSQLCQ